jgi:choline kinase
MGFYDAGGESVMVCVTPHECYEFDSLDLIFKHLNSLKKIGILKFVVVAKFCQYLIFKNSSL